MKAYMKTYRLFLLVFFVILSTALLFTSGAKAQQPAQPEKNVSTALFAVQLCSRRSLEEVDVLRGKLTKVGMPSYTVEKNVAGTLWYRLRIGFFTSKPDAELKAIKVVKLIKELKEYLIVIPSKEEIERQQ